MTFETINSIEQAAISAEKASVVLDEVCDFFEGVPLNAENIIYSHERIMILLNIIADYLHGIIQMDRDATEEWEKQKAAGA